MQRSKRGQQALGRLRGGFFGKRPELFVSDPRTRLIRVRCSGDDQEICERIAVQKRRRVYPAQIQFPARHVRRVEQFLSEEDRELTEYVRAAGKRAGVVARAT